MMFQKGIRRLFLTGGRGNSVFPFISSRDIIRFLFTVPRRTLPRKIRSVGPMRNFPILKQAKPKLFMMVISSIKRPEKLVRESVLASCAKVARKWSRDGTFGNQAWKADNHSFGQK